MIASKRKPTVPCELCARRLVTNRDGIWICAKHNRQVTAADGCTFGEYDEEGKR